MANLNDPIGNIVAQFLGSIPLADASQRMGSAGSLNPVLAPVTAMGSGVTAPGRTASDGTAVVNRNQGQEILNTFVSHNAANPGTIAPKPIIIPTGSGIDLNAVGNAAAVPAVPRVPANVAKTTDAVVSGYNAMVQAISKQTVITYRDKVSITGEVASRLSTSTLNELRSGNSLSKSQKREVENVGGKKLREQITNAQS